MRLFGLDHLSHTDTKQHQLHQQASLDAAKDSATPSLFIPSPQVSDSTRVSQPAPLPAPASSSSAAPVASSRPARSSDAAATNEPDSVTAKAAAAAPAAPASVSHPPPVVGRVWGGPSGAAHGVVASTASPLPTARRGRQATPLSVRLANSLDAEAANATAREAVMGKERFDTGKSQMISSR
jgi:hypothetical protein